MSDATFIQFVVPGEPSALQRARVSNRGGFARMHDTTANTTNKATIGFHARQVMGGAALLTCPLDLLVVCYFRKPESKIRKTGDPFPFPDTKPDADNCLKLVADALNGIVYDDDKRIVTATVQKRWAKDGVPRTEVRLIQQTAEGAA